MSITTTYKCDRCDKEQDTNNQFWRIEIGVRHSGQSSPNRLAHMDVCRFCLEALGFYRNEFPAAPLPPAPTIEELLREIVERCGFEPKE